MRPPILHWKVMLVLLVVVIGGVSVGSALNSPRNVRVFHTHGVNSVGWTGYAPLVVSGPGLRCTGAGQTARSCIRMLYAHGGMPPIRQIRRMCSVLGHHASVQQMQLRVMCSDLSHR